MPETYENWLGLVNNCVYYARQCRVIYREMPYSVNFKAPREFEIHWLREYLVNVVLFGMKDLEGP